MVRVPNFGRENGHFRSIDDIFQKMRDHQNSEDCPSLPIQVIRVITFNLISGAPVGVFYINIIVRQVNLCSFYKLTEHGYLEGNNCKSNAPS
eukprot:CAMPEP_0184447620 /NCGR_PEP_ID=MMETSP0740-20130409/3813_1 /TAXON_ID=385413 /ORGANISM="Thalassiosira miniscula, Strain CCMP1093" /LENGTH=91 /DNA_ID=CAMNT_0026817303 /DNA_START=42 /DNA_END=313 /DNA_ORIENTATION=+